tara:strand:- start:9899 stop:11869 length:1971 start_codon:yes stop_codon:yes gene_type:complete
MTVKQKTQQPSFAGIVVTASSRDEAIRNYAKVALGESLEVLASSDNSFALATVAGSGNTFLNPLRDGGETMNVVDTDLEVTSSADPDDKVVVEYAMCSECSTHIIADSCESVSNCPSCNAHVDFEADVEEEFESESSDYSELSGSQGIVVVASSMEEAQQDFIAIAQGHEPALSYVDGTNVSFISNSSDNVKFSPFYGEDVTAQDIESDSSVLKSLSSKYGNEAHYFQCVDSEECGMHIIASSEDITVCPSCSSAVVDPEDIQELEQSVLEMDAGMMEDDDIFDDEDSELDEIEADLEDDDLFDDEDDDLDDLTIVSSSDDDDVEDDDLEDDDLEDDEEDEGDDEEDIYEDDEDEEDSDDVDGLEDEEEEDVESDSSVAEVTVSLDVMEAVAYASENGLEADKIALVNAATVAGENRWIAMHSATPIAVASESNVEGTVKEIFRSQSFASAVMKSIASNGVSEGLREFGFESIAFDEHTMQTVVERSVAADAQAKVEAYASAQEERDATVVERFTAALATAMMGINRGVFNGKSNPIIDSLANTLKASGVENARQLVDNVFEANADTLNSMLVEQAVELVKKPAETQNEISRMVASASYARKDGTASTSSTFENRLQPRTVASKPQSESSAMTSQSSVASGDFKNRAAGLLKNLPR